MFLSDCKNKIKYLFHTWNCHKNIKTFLLWWHVREIFSMYFMSSHGILGGKPLKSAYCNILFTLFIVSVSFGPWVETLLETVCNYVWCCYWPQKLHTSSLGYTKCWNKCGSLLSNKWCCVFPSLISRTNNALSSWTVPIVSAPVVEHKRYMDWKLTWLSLSCRSLRRSWLCCSSRLMEPFSSSTFSNFSLRPDSSDWISSYWERKRERG